MGNPRVTKLRLMLKRADKELAEVQRKRDLIWMEYVDVMKSVGLCPNCEKKLSDCKCTILG